MPYHLCSLRILIATYEGFPSNWNARKIFKNCLFLLFLRRKVLCPSQEITCNKEENYAKTENFMLNVFCLEIIFAVLLYSYETIRKKGCNGH